jgi:hypothetical protein
VRHNRNRPANIAAVVYPWLVGVATLPGKGIQGLVAGFGASNRAWFELRLGEAGAVELLLNGAISATANRPLDPCEWYFVAVVVDVFSRRARLHVPRQRYTWPTPVAFVYLGMPTHTVVLASSVGFSDSYQRVIEETLLNTPWSGGHNKPAVRSDIVLLECPHGGRVFSVGSIGWTATLVGLRIRIGHVAHHRQRAATHS